METAVKEKKILPAILPHGWKLEVAKLLGVHQNTITNHLKIGSGKFYNKIMHVALEKYGITKN